MKGKNNNSFLNKEFWFDKTPEFFNFKFQLLTYLIDGIFLLYSIISIPLYIFYHIFGDLFINEEQNVSKDEILKIYKMNDSSLFWNLFNLFIPIGLLFFSQQLIKVQTFSFYTIFMGIQKLFIFAYLMNCNLTLIPHKSSFIYKIFNLMILLSYSLYFIYSICYYFKKKNGTKNNNIDKDTSYGKYSINVNEQPVSVDTLVHEVQLRMDMAKIKFNSIMIKLKINKIFPKIMFKPKDYYFMRKDNEKERNNEHIIRNIKGYKNINNKKNNKANNNSFQDNCSTTFGSCADSYYSKLNDDENETSPLNI